MSNRNADVSRHTAADTKDLVASLLSGAQQVDIEISHHKTCETLEYIRALSGELSTLAQKNDQRLLGYLLMLAAEEARSAQMRHHNAQ